MLMRHLGKFMTENGPTVATESLTYHVVADDFFKALRNFHFNCDFIAGLRAALRDVEHDDGLRG
eukprot:CAMPEP_0181328646 /NCGR_PEP_ID=MMETSP1101-20121128/22848_1 /TAXON_ID=46948 /ORGANISM="Rhodomonas abbreviata, Strain Caron Lab Isolate" /LENGTH=63 /DNA_ID=CAMNT_0023437591 /DNA_START=213 /DNA_END=404 /DNA_ORIENTATION=-